MKIRHKYKAMPTTVDNIRFDSKKEAQYYRELVARQKLGDVVFFLRQVPFHLPGGVVFRCDFQEFLSDGTVQFIDVKGYRTKQYIMKKKNCSVPNPMNTRSNKQLLMGHSITHTKNYQKSVGINNAHCEHDRLVQKMKVRKMMHSTPFKSRVVGRPRDGYDK